MKHFWFLLLLSVGLAAAPVSIGTNDSDISLLEHSDIYIEQNAKLQHPPAPKTDGDYKPFGADFVSFGYMNNEAVWIRFSLQNNGDTELTRVLHIDNSMLDSLTLYEDGGNPKNNGAVFYKKFDGIIDFHFDITLKPKETKHYYLRIMSNSCASYYHLYVKTKDKLWEKNNKRQMILAFFASVMLTLIVYNAFIYAFTREKVYLYYVLFLAFTTYNYYVSYTGMMLAVFRFLGASDEFIIGFTTVDAYLGLYYFVVLCVLFVLFFMELVNSKRYRYIHNTAKTFIVFYLFIGVIPLFAPYNTLDIAVLSTVVMFLFALVAIVFLAFKKEENSSYLLLGQGINAFGTILFLAYNFGIYIPKGGYWYFYEMSLTAEAFLFSMVLSKKLRRTKALETALSTQKILIRELHHRVKNNLQFIVSLYRLRLKKHLDDKGKTILSEAEQNIRSIGKIHEILYNRQSIETLDSKGYFEDLARELRRGYKTENIEIVVVGDLELDVDRAIYCGIIVNELVTNSIKHAFGEGKGGTIVISAQRVDDINRLTVSDNGAGYDKGQVARSFGLNLVERLAVDELKGSITVNTQKGVSSVIEWHR